MNTVICNDNGAGEDCAAMVAALCSDSLPEPANGGLYEVGSGRLTRLRWQASGGWIFSTQEPLTPEKVAQKIPKITDFEDGRSTYPFSIDDGTKRAFGNQARSGPKL